jgi:ATP-binding cassette subfamily F protein 3
MLSGANFIILDEPTNHLDINSREALEDALSTFDGTILAVSHDRYFLNKLASRIIELEKSTVYDYGGNYSFYNEHRLKRKLEAEDQSGSQISSSKFERMANKEEQTRARRLEKKLLAAENEINRIEARINAIAKEMCDEAVYSDHVKVSELHEEETNLKERLDELYILWSELDSGKLED